MLFSYNWLQSFFKEKLPRPEKLADLLTMHSFEIEEVKKQNKDFILDIDVLPNRGCDCFSHLGIAREISVLTTYNLQLTTYKPKEDKKIKTKDFIEVEVKDKNACKRYTARFVTGVNISASPKWMQERLMACGLQSINNVVDVLNYVMLETGQPLHAFDCEKLEGRKLVVRFATKRERIVTLDEKNYELDNDILVIADEKKPVAIAGIKGGKIPEIDENTKNIIIESANFDQRIIRYVSKKLNLRTDASIRFENGIDPNLTEEAINRAVFLIQQLAQGKTAEGMIDVYPKKVFPKKIKLDLNYVESLLGTKIPQKEIIRILKSLGFKVKKEGEQFSVTIPTLRRDISIPEDLIEEIGRIYGYEKIQTRMPVLPIFVAGKNKDLLWERKIKEMLKGLGLNEVYLYSFISEKDAELFSTNKNLRLIEIKNPASSNTKYLRPSLLPNLLKIIERNQMFLKKEIKVFEVGKIYYQNVKGKMLKVEKQSSSRGSLYSTITENTEKKIIAGIIAGRDKFFELKGILEGLFEGLGMVDVFFDEFKATPEETPQIFWQIGESAEIKIGDIEVGFLGKIRPEILNFYNINKTPTSPQDTESVEVVAFEIDFEKLLNLVEEEHEYKMPSPYPESIKDIAVLVPSQTLAGEVIQTIHQIDEDNLVRDVEIFDIFEGPPLPEGKKNLAFHIILQANDRTLSSKEIDAILKKIIKGLEENEEWKVRR